MVHLGPKPPQHRKGSLHDVPEALLKELEQLESVFNVSAETLRKITDHFVLELEKGLSKKGGNIPMIPGWVLDFPTGKETGDYLAIDLGGTNLRVVLVKLAWRKQRFRHHSVQVPIASYHENSKERGVVGLHRWLFEEVCGRRIPRGSD